MEQIRLQKFLASNGIASRRKCEELISARQGYGEWKNCYRIGNQDKSRDR